MTDKLKKSAERLATDIAMLASWDEANTALLKFAEAIMEEVRRDIAAGGGRVMTGNCGGRILVEEGEE